MDNNSRRRPYRVARKQVEKNNCFFDNLNTKNKKQFKMACAIILIFTFIQGLIIGHLVSKK